MGPSMWKSVLQICMRKNAVIPHCITDALHVPSFLDSGAAIRQGGPFTVKRPISLLFPPPEPSPRVAPLWLRRSIRHNSGIFASLWPLAPVTEMESYEIHRFIA